MSNKTIISCQTVDKEGAYLIGTPSQLLATAAAIIKAVKEAKDHALVNEDIKMFPLDLLDKKGDLLITDVVVVESDKQKETLFNKLYAG